jgi:hypothetical protein
MNFLKLLLILFNAIINSILCAETSDTSTLRLLQIVHRNGDQTPISFYPNDPYNSIDKWVDGSGELTIKGKDRMYDFGKELRDRYKEYLGKTLKNIQIKSSAANRCIESAAALVAALYPPEDRCKWSEENIAENWQPIVIRTDGMLDTNSKCPAAEQALEEIMQSKEVKQFMESNKEFIEKVGNKTGVKYTKLKELDYLYDTLHNETTFDESIKLPDWLKDIGNDTLEKLKQFESNAFKYESSSKKIQRLRAGLILKELTQNMKNARDLTKQKTMKKVYSYATHDTLIVSILQALGIYSGIPPSYGSALLFELHQNSNNQSFVQLFYANVTPIVTINEINLTICASNLTNCELSKLLVSIEDLIPKDWIKECNLANDRKCKVMLHDMAHAAIGFGVGVVTLITSVLIAFLIKKSRKRKQFFANSNSVNNQYIKNLR